MEFEWTEPIERTVKIILDNTEIMCLKADLLFLKNTHSIRVPTERILDMLIKGYEDKSD